MNLSAARDTAALPLQSHIVFRSSELDRTRAHVAGQYQDHVLTPHGDAPLDMRHHRATLRDVSLNYLAYGSAVLIDPSAFEDFFMVEFPLAGGTEIMFGRNRIVTHAGTAAVISPTVPLTSSWSAGCAQMMLKIRRSTLERLLTETLGRSMKQPLIFAPSLSLKTGHGATLLALIDLLCTDFERPDGAIGFDLFRAGIEQSILSLLLENQPSNYHEAIRSRSAAAAPKHVVRAVHYIEEHAAEPITVGDLIRVSGVSGRALFEGFARFKDITPMAYLRNVRLNRAREELLDGPVNRNIADVARRWGFGHTGRFAADYKRRFGELPSETGR